MKVSAAEICRLNDAFRRHLCGGRVLVTPGLSSRSDLSAIVEAVSKFDKFDADNDPYEEHDFGSFDHAGETIFWKIDYYDSTMNSASPNAADPAVTTRLLTIMLAEEY